MRDHERPDSYGRSSARGDAGWGRESQPYIADPLGAVTMPVLLLARGDRNAIADTVVNRTWATPARPCTRTDAVDECVLP